MSAADILSIVSLVLFILSALNLIAAVVLFFVFKIPMVIGDLSGKNARKSVERIRENNSKGPVKAYKPSFTNANRGTVTSNMAEKTDKKEKKTKGRKSRSGGPGSELTAALGADKRANGPGSEATTLLDDRANGPGSDATTLLDDRANGPGSDATTLLDNRANGPGSDATTLLNERPAPAYSRADSPMGRPEYDDADGTSVLMESAAAAPRAARSGGVSLRMLDDVMIIHTDETI